MLRCSRRNVRPESQLGGLLLQSEDSPSQSSQALWRDASADTCFQLSYAISTQRTSCTFIMAKWKEWWGWNKGGEAANPKTVLALSLNDTLDTHLVSSTDLLLELGTMAPTWRALFALLALEIKEIQMSWLEEASSSKNYLSSSGSSTWTQTRFCGNHVGDFVSIHRISAYSLNFPKVWISRSYCFCQL